jgi:pilus assembly protein CpaB
LSILKNRTVLGLLCIVLSLIVCFGLTPLFNGAVNARAEIVRLTEDVKKGGMITADMITAAEVGGWNLPGDVIKEPESAIGRYAKYDMQAGDHIRAGKLSDEPLAEFSYLQELDGTHEAMSVTIKSFAAGLSGKLEAGDIISLIASDAGEFRETLAPPELRYVKVLAVTDGSGQDKEYGSGSEPEDGEEKELPSAITLLVVPRQAQLLAELETAAKLHCTLVYRGTPENCEKFLQIQAGYFADTDVKRADEAENPGRNASAPPVGSTSAGKQEETAGMTQTDETEAAADGE